MTLRSRLRKSKVSTVADPTLPVWVVQGSVTTQALFKAASDEFARIANLIAQKASLSPKERRIVASRVAYIASKDRSIINARRQVELVDWIDRANESLSQLYELHKPSNTVNKPKNLQNEVAALRKELKALQEVNAKEFVDRVFESNLLDNRDKLAAEVIALKRKNTELLKKVDILQGEREKQDRKISLLLIQLHKL